MLAYAVIDGECASYWTVNSEKLLESNTPTNVLTVVAKRVSDYMALIGIRATPAGSEAERVAWSYTSIKTLTEKNTKIAYTALRTRS